MPFRTIFNDSSRQRLELTTFQAVDGSSNNCARTTGVEDKVIIINYHDQSLLLLLIIIIMQNGSLQKSKTLTVFLIDDNGIGS